MQVRIADSWQKRLQKEFDQPYLARLVAFVKDEYAHYQVLPKGSQIFHIFNACPFEQVKVVILGQDPYPTPGQYYGVCFSVPEHTPIPGSLANIYQEIHTDLGLPVPTSGCLDKWVEQGVFSMNTVLTVRAYQTGSHKGKGWETFTDAVIRFLILTAAHPSPRSADHGFFGCRHFSKANAFLVQHGMTPIDWSV